ncbi:hypothetical protein GYA13_01190 [Candidatus Kuenenbacteria bacterium]|nr:hypothetical protein [Candidatus Kuenenbacteria bacterium]
MKSFKTALPKVGTVVNLFQPPDEIIQCSTLGTAGPQIVLCDGKKRGTFCECDKWSYNGKKPGEPGEKIHEFSCEKCGNVVSFQTCKKRHFHWQLAN